MTAEEAKAIKSGSCPACWPFACERGYSRCQGVCGRSFHVNELRRRAYGWVCRACDAKREDIYAARGVG